MIDLFSTSHHDTNSRSYLFPRLSTVPSQVCHAAPFPPCRAALRREGEGAAFGKERSCLQSSAVRCALHLLWAAEHVIYTLWAAASPGVPFPRRQRGPGTRGDPAGPQPWDRSPLSAGAERRCERQELEFKWATHDKSKLSLPEGRQMDVVPFGSSQLQK